VRRFQGAIIEIRKALLPFFVLNTQHARIRSDPHTQGQENYGLQAGGGLAQRRSRARQ